MACPGERQLLKRSRFPINGNGTVGIEAYQDGIEIYGRPVLDHDSLLQPRSTGNIL